jgi:hypothetical protein
MEPCKPTELLLTIDIKTEIKKEHALHFMETDVIKKEA